MGNVVALLGTGSFPDRELVSLDGDTGLVQWRHALPRSPGGVILNNDCALDYDTYGHDWPANARALTIDERGTAYLYLDTRFSLFDYASGDQCENYHYEESGWLALMAVTEGGQASTTTLRSYAVQHTAPAATFQLPPYTVGWPGTMLPVSGGGVLATRADSEVSSGGTVQDYLLSSHDTTTSFTTHFGSSELRLTAMGEAGQAVAEQDGQSLLLDSATGGTTATMPGEALQVLAGNELLVRAGAQVEHRTVSGAVVATAPFTVLENAVHIAGALWAKVRDDSAAVGGLYGMFAHPANAVFPLAAPLATILSPNLPVVRNLSHESVVLKNEGCLAGFSTVPAQSSYYRWVDGVMPPTVTGWNPGDWFKVPDLAHIVVQGSGAQPTAHGPSTMLVPGSARFCRQDDRTQPGYADCWGRRIEPLWSTPQALGGSGAEDWRHPPPGNRACGAVSRWKIWEWL